MSERIQIEANREITAEACAWVAQIGSGNLSAEDLSALREWMGRSPAHAKEIRDIARLSGRLSVLTEMAEPLAAASSIGEGLRRRRRLPWLPAVAAGAIAACLAVIAVFFAPQDAVAPSVIAYETAVGEYRVVRLEDGTSVKLNTASRIEVVYEEAVRRVRLARGEAVFDVAANPARPFEVLAGDSMARALGTSFVVRLREKVTELSVIEGAVRFSRTLEKAPPVRVEEASAPERGRMSEPAVVLRAGEALTSAQIPQRAEEIAALDVETIAPRELKRRISWTDGVFDFSDTPLPEVIEEVNRYSRVRVEIVDPNLRTLKFGGIFEIGDLDALLEALETLGIRIDRVGEDRILLRAERA